MDTEKRNPVCDLFGIDIPIIQAGMVWCSGWKLASAVSNTGALGLIGAGSMYPHILEEHLIKCKNATEKPFGVNLPLLYPEIDQHLELIKKYEVPIVFTSAGNPAKFTDTLKSFGAKVVHVVSSTKFALKAEKSGVDAVVAEGFEAGGHNGRDETTTLCLLPAVRDAIALPLIAAGGIASGRAMLAARILGADAVQIGSRFVASEESSAHPVYKQKIIEAAEGDTLLSMKSLTPVRLLKNEFFFKVKEAEAKGAGLEELKELLGKGRAKKGMFEGDLVEGELEIGQVSGMISAIKSAKEIIQELQQEYERARSATY